MKHKKFFKGGSWNIRSLRNLKAELAQLRRDRDTEKKKALLSSIQRDYFRALLDYANEYVIATPQTWEQYKERKQLYESFAHRLQKEYGEEAKPIVLELNKKYLGAYYTLMVEYPYRSQSHRP